MKISVNLGLMLAIMVWPGRVALGWLRMPYEDVEVVTRSELIVVASIEPGSVVYVPHEIVQGGRSWEHRAVLRISEVLKGKCDRKDIPVVIHYGLEPLIDGHGDHDDPKAGEGGKGAIEIYDEGNSGGGVLTEDARKDAVWLLRRGTLGSGHGDLPTDDYGIIDPEDVQPVELKDYLMCYLSSDPEGAVRAILPKQPEVAERGTRYLEHRQVQRISSTENDPAVRVERLLPYYAGRFYWRGQWEARAGIVAAGVAAGPYLMAVYQGQHDPRMDEDIIWIWGKIRYAGCVDVLIDLLKKGDAFWDFPYQKIKPGGIGSWWNDSTDWELTQERRTAYGDTMAAVATLGRIGDPQAREAIEMTRRRWGVDKLNDEEMRKACEGALKGLAQTGGGN